MQCIGVISDTHGMLRPQVVQFLEGCERIIHAGDICDAAILERLSALAPVTAVRGNNDFGSWAEELHETELVRMGEVGIYVSLAETEAYLAGLPAGLYPPAGSSERK